MVKYMKILHSTLWNSTPWPLYYAIPWNSTQWHIVLQNPSLLMINTIFPQWHIYLFCYHCQLKWGFMGHWSNDLKKCLRSYIVQLSKDGNWLDNNEPFSKEVKISMEKKTFKRTMFQMMKSDITYPVYYRYDFKCNI